MKGRGNQRERQNEKKRKAGGCYKRKKNEEQVPVSRKDEYATQ